MGVCGSTKAEPTWSSKRPVVWRRRLCFHEIHDGQIVISDDGRAARLLKMTNVTSDVTGRCFSKKPMKTNETVLLTASGSGFIDIGLTDVHPSKLRDSKEFVCKYITNKVLFFDHVEVRVRVGSDGTVYLRDGTQKEVPIRLRAKAKCHWLALRLGCGEVTVIIDTVK